MIKQCLIVVDMSNFIFRAFYATPPMNAPDGTPTNAVRGVLSMLLKLLSDYRPTHILIAKDTPGGCFRNNIYPDYKANRTDPPEELSRQFPVVASLLVNMQLPSMKSDIYEADDIIGSAVFKWRENFDEILIASGDKDLMQCVGGPVKMLDTMKGKIYDEKAVFEKMGVYPDQIVDYLSMVGDRSDNIPGMKGIGAKGASKLLAQYKTFEECIKHKATFRGKKLTEAFSRYLDDGLLSKKLIKIVTNVDMDISLQKMNYSFYPNHSLIGFLKGLGFKTMLNQLEEIKEQVDNVDNKEKDDLLSSFDESPVKKSDVTIVKDEKSLKDLIVFLESAMAFSFYTEFDKGQACERDIIGIGISFDGIKSYYCPLSGTGLNIEQKRKVLTTCWSHENVEVLSDHIQQDISYCLSHNIEFKAQTFDISQAFYNIKSSAKNELDVITGELLGEVFLLWDKDKEWEKIHDEEFASEYFSWKAMAVYKVAATLKEQLKEKSLEDIYYKIDDPLFQILAKMEHVGISVNREFFSDLEKTIRYTLGEKEKILQSYAARGPINLNSPKQVGEFLFTDLGLPIIKKTKTGLSTDSEVLFELASKKLSPVPQLLLEHRELGKLLSTYVTAIPSLVNKKTGRVHTHFHQNITATGRLSSSHPNLQNIPVKSETGKTLRKGFEACKGCVFLGADYSQVELRILAYFSKDETMLHSFAEGKDIHAQTASEIFGVDIEEVTLEERSKAKAVNFGLIYGQSSFGLAKNLRISRKEARKYITTYFERFSQVKIFLDGLKEECYRKGYVSSYHGRKRFLPDIRSQNRTIKANAERMAINAPIQATAADIIKMAMLNIDKRLQTKKLNSKMILQVHDELIFEVPHEEVPVMKNIVTEEMENACDVIPLKVDVNVAENWFDLK